MAGNATLGSTIIDDLVTVADSIRSDLNTAFGSRQFTVSTVLRTWSQGFIGEGTYSDVETAIDPAPLVLPYNTELNLQPCGIDEAGYIQMREISLTYTEADLTGSYGSSASIAANQEWLFKIEDALTQEIETTYWVLKTKPYPDRVKTIGWIMELRKAGATS